MGKEQAVDGKGEIAWLFELGARGISDFWRLDGKVEVDATTGTLVTGSNPATLCHDFYPERVFEEVSLKIVFVAEEKKPLRIDLPPYIVSVGGHPFYSNTGPHYACIARTAPHDVVRSARMVVRQGQENVLHIDYGKGRVQASLNGGDKMEVSSDYEPTIDKIEIVLPPRCSITRLDVAGREVPPKSRPARSRTYTYHIVSDWPADVAPNPFTREMFEQMMEGIARRGFTRFYSIYYGGRKSGMWDLSENNTIPDEHIEKTFHGFGDTLLEGQVEMAHWRGLEIFATIKPFDIGLGGYTFPFGSPLAAKYGKCDTLGGKAFWMTNFAAERSDLWMKRRRARTVSGPVAKIVLSSVDVEQSQIADVEVWVSPDNRKYKKYEGPRSVTRQPGRIVIDGLAVREPFFALVPVSGGARNTFSNSPSELVRLYNARCEPLPFTYGFAPRFRYEYEKGQSSYVYRQVYSDFREDGFYFNFVPELGIPTCCMCGDSPLNHWFALDNEHGAVGIALGKEGAVPGLLCPSEPDSRNYWLGWIEEVLGFGVDGVSIRRWNHSNCLEWKEYGFNNVVVDEYKRRYGVDVRTEKFDMESWRRLRGEYYTQLLREASELVRRHGKKIQIHIDDQMDATPDASTVMEMHWDWERWLEERLADEIAIKALHEESYRSYFCQRVIARCQEKGIPVFYSPAMHRWGVLHRSNWKEYLSTGVRDCGASGFVVYEHASLIRGGSDGKLHEVETEALQHLERLAKEERRAASEDTTSGG